MILYTYQSMESIFPVQDEEYSKQEMVDIPGGQLVLERSPAGEGSAAQDFRIVRLLSTDPNMFLDAKYQPGQPYSFQK